MTSLSSGSSEDFSSSQEELPHSPKVDDWEFSLSLFFFSDCACMYVPSCIPLAQLAWSQALSRHRALGEQGGTGVQKRFPYRSIAGRTTRGYLSGAVFYLDVRHAGKKMPSILSREVCTYRSI